MPVWSVPTLLFRRSSERVLRAMVADGDFVEIHVNTPLDVAEQRDKGLP